MKRTKLFFWITLIILSTGSPLLADVKIKTRNTVADQISESTVYIKGKRQRSEQDFGGMKSVTLTQCDLRRDAHLNTQAKTYFLALYNSGDTNSPDAQSTPQNEKTKTSYRKGGLVTTTITLKDTGERKQMFGYTARRILSTVVMESSPDACSPAKTRMETDGWYIDAEFVFECLINQQFKQPQADGAGCTDRQEFKQVGSAKLGYPVYLKTTIRGENGEEDFTSTTEVLEISPATLDASLFEIPADFRQVKSQAALFEGGISDTDDEDQGADDERKENQQKSVFSQTVKKSARPDANSGTNLNQNASSDSPAAIKAKKSAAVRLGIMPVKIESVGVGMNAGELSAAIRNSLAEYLKGTNIELIEIESRTPHQIKTEAEQKKVDYVIHAAVAHKKGGGSFGKFLSKAAPVFAAAIPGRPAARRETPLFTREGKRFIRRLTRHATSKRKTSGRSKSVWKLPAPLCPASISKPKPSPMAKTSYPRLSNKPLRQFWKRLKDNCKSKI